MEKKKATTLNIPIQAHAHFVWGYRPMLLALALSVIYMYIHILLLLLLGRLPGYIFLITYNSTIRLQCWNACMVNILA